MKIKKVRLLWEEADSGVQEVEEYRLGDRKEVGHTLHFLWELKKIETGENKNATR